MSPRLQLELLIRRHGPVRFAAYLTLLLIAFAGLNVLHPPATPTTPVEATDGRRQLADRYRTFRHVLTPAAGLEAQRRAILEAVAQHHLAMGPVDFSHEINAAGQFATTRLQITLTGRYGDLRSFLVATLHQHPAVALDDLSIQQAAAGPGIQARLRFIIHTESAEGSSR